MFFYSKAEKIIYSKYFLEEKKNTNLPMTLTQLCLITELLSFSHCSHTCA